MDLDVMNVECFIQGQRECNKYDPRPDLKDDHKYWKLVLREADKLDHNLYSILHGYRCIGTRLKKDDEVLKLKKGEEWEKYWANDKAYKLESHKNLLTYHNLIREILKRALQQDEQLALFLGWIILLV